MENQAGSAVCVMHRQFTYVYDQISKLNLIQDEILAMQWASE